jgi:hypothetical protein
MRFMGRLGASMVGGLLLIVLGLVYIAKPTIFRRGIWLKTSIAVRTLSEENYIRYMRGLGAVIVLVGLGLILRAAFF